MPRFAPRAGAFFLAVLALCALACEAQAPANRTSAEGGQLRFAVYLSRHGVRSPTGSATQYNPYSTAPWPEWNAAPGYLTAHGYQLMQIFGAYDRLQLSGEGLLSATGCEDAARVTFYADSDQRTRETGKALAAGLFPGCAPQVKGFPEGTPDVLFHPLEAHSTLVDPALAVAAISGRIGGNPDNPTDAYRAQLTELDTILAKCGDPAMPAAKRQSILEVPARLMPGTGDHLAELRGPLSTASTLTENLLLEYTEGMDAANVGWGCVNGTNLGSLLELHTAASEFSQRPKPIARAQASNLLHQIVLALSQAATGKAAPGAISRVSDRALFLIGHDTNIASIAGLLGLDWIADGRRDDTPPGGALVFELWQPTAGSEDFVRVYYTTQTLEQMRSATVLTSQNPPVRVPVFIPACSRADFACSLQDFERALRSLTAGSNRHADVRRIAKP
jgi:4-phytase/acid phosphatase